FNNIKNLGTEYFGMSIEQRSSFYTLDRVSGVVKSGETCLILGKSGSGKSTLLRALCSRLNETDDLYGTVALNGIPIGKSNQGWRRMCSYVSPDDGTHSPVLTVGETFEFAARCTMGEVEEEGIVDERVNFVLEALGLSHVKNTVVGDENLRGVSGGQKRRVTVGEMLLNPTSRVHCLDNITDGLASTDSFSLIQQISIACKKHRLASIITLLQPSDEIIGLFDKLLVLSSDGQPSYFGPVDRQKLREVFVDGDASKDSGSIADLVMNQAMSKASLNEPNTKEEKASNAYLNSDLYLQLTKEIANIRAEAPPIQDREAALNALLPDSMYSTSRWHQLQIIASRRKKLIMRNSMTYARVVIAIIFGAIVGSLFSTLKQDTVGALGRSGYIFLSSFLVLMLSSAVTLPDGFRQRITLFKHRNAEFYSGTVAYIVQMAMDLPLSIIEATLIASISYFWVDMTPGANHFFLFLFTLIGLECVGQAFGRVLCALSRTQVSANVTSSLCILLFATVGGFMPAYGSVTWLLRWLSWITPVAYAFEAMMINQFDGTTFFGLVIVNENGTSTTGSVDGTNYLNSQSLPRSQWTSNNGIMIFDVIMLFIIAIVLDVIGMHFQERTRQWYFNQIRRPRATVARTTVSESCVRVFGSRREQLCNPWLDLCSQRLPERVVKARKQSTKKRTKMVALMGQSGAGKTTLLDVIAGYKTGGKITGDILIDGYPKSDSTWKAIAGYAEQQDILNPYMSVLETIEFTANCRLPPTVDKQAIINDVIELMGLEAYTNMIVGREKEGEGLPKHARKRVTIANQLVVQPKILFLDEPTSGLGVNAAALVMGAVRRSTDKLGLITLVTIHQPSRKMFESFDDLLLLAEGGRVSYCGELGNNSETLLKHFATLSGETPPSNSNPADYVLSVLDNGSPDEAVSTFEASELAKDIGSAIDADVSSANERSPVSIRGDRLTFFTELGLLFKRQFLVQWRNPSYSFMRMSVSAGASFVLGLLFFDIKKNIQGAVFAIAAIFFMTFVLVIPMQAAVIPLIADRSVLYREAVSGTYSRFSYGLGQLLADIPFHAANTVIMYAIIYYLVGFRTGAEHVGFFIFMLFLANVMSMGQLYALCTPNEETANGLAGLSVILSVCLMGFLVSSSVMPEGWLWAYNANLFRYILQGLVTNEI
ncbi:ABC transporter protein, partial [Thalassiosira pseudonana CCMP1335]